MKKERPIFMSNKGFKNLPVEKETDPIRLYFPEPLKMVEQQSKEMKQFLYTKIDGGYEQDPSNPDLKSQQVKSLYTQQLKEAIAKSTKSNTSEFAKDHLELQQQIKNYRKYTAPRIRKSDLRKNEENDLYKQERERKKERLGKVYREERTESQVKNEMKVLIANKLTRKRQDQLKTYKPYHEYLDDQNRVRNVEKENVLFSKQANRQQLFVADRKAYRIEPLTKVVANGKKEVTMSALQQSLTDFGKTQLLGTIGLLPEEGARKIILEATAKEEKKTVRYVQNQLREEDVKVRGVFEGQQKDRFYYKKMQCLITIEEKEKNDKIRLKRELGAFDDKSYEELKVYFKKYYEQAVSVLEEDNILLSEESVRESGQDSEYGKQELEMVLEVTMEEEGWKVGIGLEKVQKENLEDSVRDRKKDGGEVSLGEMYPKRILKSQKQRMEENIVVLRKEYPGDDSYEYLTPTRLLYENYRKGRGLGEKVFDFVRISHSDCRKMAEQEIEEARKKCKEKTDQVYLGENASGQKVFVGVAVQKDVLVVGDQFSEGGLLDEQDMKKDLGFVRKPQEMVRINIPVAVYKKEKKDGERDRNTYVELVNAFYDSVRKLNRELKDGKNLEKVTNTILPEDDKIERRRTKEEGVLKGEYNSIRFHFMRGNRQKQELRLKREMKLFRIEHEGRYGNIRNEDIVDKSLTLSPGTMKYETELNRFVTKQNIEAREEGEYDSTKVKSELEVVARKRAEEKLLVSGLVKRKHEDNLYVREKMYDTREGFATTLPKVGGGSEFQTLADTNSLYKPRNDVERKDSKGRLGDGGLRQAVKEDSLAQHVDRLKGTGRTRMENTRTFKGEGRRQEEAVAYRMLSRDMRKTAYGKKRGMKGGQDLPESVRGRMVSAGMKGITLETGFLGKQRQTKIDELKTAKDADRAFLLATTYLDALVKKNKIVEGSKEQKEVEEKREELKDNYRLATVVNYKLKHPKLKKSVLGHQYEVSSVAKTIAESVAKTVLSVGSSTAKRRSLTTLEMQQTRAQPLKQYFQEEKKKISVNKIVEKTRTFTEERQTALFNGDKQKSTAQAVAKDRKEKEAREKAKREPKEVEEEKLSLQFQLAIVAKNRPVEVVEKEKSLMMQKKAVEVDLSEYKKQIEEKQGEEFQRRIMVPATYHFNIQRISVFKAQRNEEEKEVKDQVVKKIREVQPVEKKEEVVEQNTELEIPYNIISLEVNEEDIAKLPNKQQYRYASDKGFDKDKKMFQDTEMYEMVKMEKPRKAEVLKSPYFETDVFDKYGQNLRSTVRGESLIRGERKAEREEKQRRDLLKTTYQQTKVKKPREEKQKELQKRQAEVFATVTTEKDFTTRMQKTDIASNVTLRDNFHLQEKNSEKLILRDLVGLKTQQKQTDKNLEKELKNLVQQDVLEEERLDDQRTALSNNHMSDYEQDRRMNLKDLEETQKGSKRAMRKAGGENLVEKNVVDHKHEKRYDKRKLQDLGNEYMHQPSNSQKQFRGQLLKNVALQKQHHSEQSNFRNEQNKQDKILTAQYISRINNYVNERDTEFSVEAKNLNLRLLGLSQQNGEEREVANYLDGQREAKSLEGETILYDKIGMSQKKKEVEVPETIPQIFVEQDVKNRRKRTKEEEESGLVLNHGYYTLVGNVETSGSYGYLGRRSDATLSHRTVEYQENTFRMEKGTSGDERDVQRERSAVDRKARSEVRGRSMGERRDGDRIRRGQISVVERRKEILDVQAAVRDGGYFAPVNPDVQPEDMQMKRKMQPERRRFGTGRYTLNSMIVRDVPYKENVQFANKSFTKLEEEVKKMSNELEIRDEDYQEKEEESQEQKRDREEKEKREEKQKKQETLNKFMEDLEKETLENLGEEFHYVQKNSKDTYSIRSEILVIGDSKRNLKRVRGRQDMVKSFGGGYIAGQGIVRDGEIISLLTFMFEVSVARTGIGGRRRRYSREAMYGQYSIGYSGREHKSLRVRMAGDYLPPGGKMRVQKKIGDMKNEMVVEYQRVPRKDLQFKRQKNPLLHQMTRTLEMQGGYQAKKKYPKVTDLEQDKDIVFYGGSQGMQLRYNAVVRDQRQRNYARSFQMNRATIKMAHRQVQEHYIRTVAVHGMTRIRAQQPRMIKLYFLYKDGIITKDVQDRFHGMYQKAVVGATKKFTLFQKYKKRQRKEEQKIRVENALVMSEMDRKTRSEEKKQAESNARGYEDQVQETMNEGQFRKRVVREMKHHNTLRKKGEGDTGRYGKAGVSPFDFGYYTGGVGTLSMRKHEGRNRDVYGYRQEVVGSFMSRTGEHVLKTSEMAHVAEKRGEMFGSFLSPCAFQSVDTECETVPYVNYGAKSPREVQTGYETFTVFSRGFHLGGSQKYGEYCHQHEETDIQKHTNKLRSEISSVNGLRVVPRMQLILHSNEGEFFKQKFDQGQLQQYGLFNANVLKQENANQSQQKIGEFDKFDFLSREDNYAGREYETITEGEQQDYNTKYRTLANAYSKVDKKKGNKQIMKQGGNILDVSNQTYRIVKSRPSRVSGLRTRKQNKYVAGYSGTREQNKKREQDISISETRGGRKGKELSDTGRKEIRDMKIEVTTPAVVRDEKQKLQKLVEISQKKVKKRHGKMLSPEISREASNLMSSLNTIRRGGELKPLMDRRDQDGRIRQRLGKRVEDQKEVILKDSKTSRVKLTLETRREVDKGGRRRRSRGKKKNKSFIK